jgi:hypothetical protein
MMLVKLFHMMEKLIILSKRITGYGTECQWFTSIILATWKTEIGRISVQGQHRQIDFETPSQPIAGHSGVHLSSKAMREAERGSPQFQANPGQKKFLRPPSQQKKSRVW